MKSYGAPTPLAISPDAPPGDAVLRGGALGDFVLTLPAIAALRETGDEGMLIIGDPARASLASPTDIVSADSAAWSRLYAGSPPEPSLRRRFAGCRRLLAYVAGGEVAAPGLVASLRQLADRVVVADPLPVEGEGTHMASHLTRPLAEFGIRPPVAPLPRVDVPPRTRRRGPVVVHPGSGSPEKCWPVPRFARILEWISRRGPAVVLLGPAEEARREQLDPFLPANRLSPATPIELAEALAGARLYIGNDSGPGHLAAAVGTPTISLFGPTDASIWRPLGPRSTVIEAPGANLDSLPVEEVLGAVEAELALDPC